MATPFDIDPRMIKHQLDGRSRQHHIAFAAACCERLLPNYRRFWEQESWGDYPLLRSVLDEIWDYAQGTPPNSARIAELQAQCVAVTPDTNNFQTLLVSHALDAGVALYEALALCLDGTLKHTVAVANSALDTVDMFIQELEQLDPSDPDFEERIALHPLTTREWGNQAEDLRFLRQQDVVNVTTVKFLRSKYEGRSNIATGL